MKIKQASTKSALRKAIHPDGSPLFRKNKRSPTWPPPLMLEGRLRPAGHLRHRTPHRRVGGRGDLPSQRGEAWTLFLLPVSAARRASPHQVRRRGRSQAHDGPRLAAMGVSWPAQLPPRSFRPEPGPKDGPAPPLAPGQHLSPP